MCVNGSLRLFLFRGKLYIVNKILRLSSTTTAPSHTVQIYIFLPRLLWRNGLIFHLFKVLFFQRIYGTFQYSVNFDEILLPQIEQIFFIVLMDTGLRACAMSPTFTGPSSSMKDNIRFCRAFR